MVHHAVSLDAVPDVFRQIQAAGFQFLVLIASSQQFRGLLQCHHGHHVGGDQVAELAGVIGGPESGPGHARVVDGTALAVHGQGVAGCPSVFPDKPVGRPVVMLLQGKGIHDGLDHQAELLGEDGLVPGNLIVLMGQIQGSAQRVHFVFPFPNPAAGKVAVVVLAVALALDFAVEGVGVGVQVYIESVFLDDAAENGFQILILGGILDIGLELGGAVTEPHGGDVPGDDKVTAVGQLGHGGFDGVQKALLGKRCQVGVFFSGFLLQLFSLLQQDLRNHMNCSSPDDFPQRGFLKTL